MGIFCLSFAVAFAASVSASVSAAIASATIVTAINFHSFIGGPRMRGRACLRRPHIHTRVAWMPSSVSQ